jgi:hypothetical protein
MEKEEPESARSNRVIGFPTHVLPAGAVVVVEKKVAADDDLFV